MVPLGLLSSPKSQTRILLWMTAHKFHLSPEGLSNDTMKQLLTKEI
jgi:hypothetical protein